MSWLTSITEPHTNSRDRASVLEVMDCFSDSKSLLFQLALLITGEEQSAEQCVVNACELTANGSTPFRNWLGEWAKAATVGAAINRSLGAIHEGEAAYARAPGSGANVTQDNGSDGERRLEALLSVDPAIVISQLDALARAVLVLRLALRYSLQDCVFRLNMSRIAILRSQSRAMTWLIDFHIESSPGKGAFHPLGQSL